MDYSAAFQKSLNKLKSEGRYRFFNEIERKTGSHPIATWKHDSNRSEIIVWCSNDFLAMDVHQWHSNTKIYETEEDRRFNEKLEPAFKDNPEVGTVGIYEKYTRFSCKNN